MSKQRIWEIDAFRGLFIIGMVAVHFIYDLQNFFGLSVLTGSRLYAMASNWGGVLFFLLSGICVTLGSRPARRGLIVLCWGLGISAVTAVLYVLNLAGGGILIYFGVLHCLGVCMLLWPLCQRLSRWWLPAVAAGIIVPGIALFYMEFSTGLWLLPLGWRPAGFVSADYFPLLPFFGFFLLGAFLGKTLYKNKKTLFPSIPAESLPFSFLCWAGRRSLAIYILHQPLLLGVMYAWEAML